MHSRALIASFFFRNVGQNVPTFRGYFAGGVGGKLGGGTQPFSSKPREYDACLLITLKWWALSTPEVPWACYLALTIISPHSGEDIEAQEAGDSPSISDKQLPPPHTAHSGTLQKQVT